MNHSKEEKNKTLVLQAFDTLFNRRDYAAAEQYWSPNYIQHSAHIGPGREGLFNLIKINQKHPANAEVRAGIDCSRWRLRHRPWTVFRLRPAGELDRSGHSPNRGRNSGRALGRDSG